MTDQKPNEPPNEPPTPADAAVAVVGVTTQAVAGDAAGPDVPAGAEGRDFDQRDFDQLQAAVGATEGKDFDQLQVVAVAADTPAGADVPPNVPNVEGAPAPTGTAPAEPAETQAPPQGVPGATVDTLGAIDMPQVGADPVPLDVYTNLNAIEQLALYWGGETGTKVRNHIGRIRELLR